MTEEEKDESAPEEVTDPADETVELGEALEKEEESAEEPSGDEVEISSSDEQEDHASDIETNPKESFQLARVVALLGFVCAIFALGAVTSLFFNFDERLEMIEQNYSSNISNIDARVDNVYAKVEKVNTNFRNVRSNVESVRSNVDAVATNMNEVGSRVETLDQSVTKSMNSKDPELDQKAITILIRSQLTGALSVLEDIASDPDFRYELRQSSEETANQIRELLAERDKIEE